MRSILKTLAHLPVNEILSDLMQHINTGGVAIVQAPPNTGKTLLVPSYLYASTADPVLVLKPTRFETVSMVENMTEISETEPGQWVDCSVGWRGSRASSSMPDVNMVWVTTYNHAMTSRILQEVKTIVLDDIDDPLLDIELAKAIIHKRKQDSDVRLERVVVMSSDAQATERELRYWRDYNPKTFIVPDGVMEVAVCDVQWDSNSGVAESILQLVDSGKRGILVFVPDHQELVKTMTTLNTLHATPEYDQLPISVMGLHSLSEYEDRRMALSEPPEGYSKVLIGTSVLDGNLHFPWVDAGVSTGTYKVNPIIHDFDLGGQQVVSLSRRGLQNQIDRVQASGNASVFINCGPSHFDTMAAAQTPEILAIPTARIYMHCKRHGLNPDSLVFSPEFPDQYWDKTAEALRHLGLLNQDNQMTEDGYFANSIPVRLDTAALLTHARKLMIARTALVLAAIYEVGGLRKDRRYPHNFDATSDLFDSARAFTKMRLSKTRDYHARMKEMDGIGVSFKRYNRALEVVSNLERALNVRADFYPYIDVNQDDSSNLVHKLRQCVMAAEIEHLGLLNATKIVFHSNQAFYLIDKGSVVKRQDDVVPVSASIRAISPRGSDKRSFTVADNITLYAWEDFVAFSRMRPDVMSITETATSEDIVVLNKRYFVRTKAPEITMHEPAFTPIVTEDSSEEITEVHDSYERLEHTSQAPENRKLFYATEDKIPHLKSPSSPPPLKRVNRVVAPPPVSIKQMPVSRELELAMANNDPSVQEEDHHQEVKKQKTTVPSKSHDPNAKVSREELQALAARFNKNR